MKVLLLIHSIPILAFGLLASKSANSRACDLLVPLSTYQASLDSPYKQEKPVYSTETLLMDEVAPGCYTMQLNIYATYSNGQVLLAHTAMIQSGYGCKEKGDKVLSSQTFSKKSGPEYILRDPQINGPIEIFIAEHDALYQAFILNKEKIMGIR